MRQTHQVVNRDTALLVLLEHGLDGGPEFVRVPGWDALVVSFFDFKGKSELVLGLEGRSECGHLVDEAAKGPDVALFVVLLFVDLLRTHVVGGADVGLGVHRAVVHDPGEAKVAQLCVLVLVQKDVARFDVAVQDFLRTALLLNVLRLILKLAPVDRRRLRPAMAEVKARDDLGQDFPDEVLLDVFVGAEAALDDLLKVSAAAIFHDDVEFEVALVDASVVVAHNVGVL